jgi:hypothetical protein
MGNLIKLDEDHWQVKETINHIQQLQKEQHDNEGKMKSFNGRDLVLWMPKAMKIKGGKFRLPWKGPFKVQKKINNK